MEIVLSQIRLGLKDLDHLIKEFPQYLFLSFTEFTYKELKKEDWKRVEILYGSRLTPEELSFATELHWIHAPSPSLTKLCLHEIKERGNILLTTTAEENVAQIGEFAIAAVLTFAKNFLNWHEAKNSPRHVWVSRWRDNMMTLKDRVFLQVGLEEAGTEITRHARQLGMKVWGMEPKPSFHPYCHKTFSLQDLSSLLPLADVVSLTLPPTPEYDSWFQEKQFELIKKDAILLIFGSYRIVEEEALAKCAERLRGILLDASYQTPIPLNSPLWNIPNIIITPEVSPRPKSKQTQSFATFRYNLRQYTYGNFQDMRNLVGSLL